MCRRPFTLVISSVTLATQQPLLCKKKLTFLSWSEATGSKQGEDLTQYHKLSNYTSIDGGCSSSTRRFTNVKRISETVMLPGEDCLLNWIYSSNNLDERSSFLTVVFVEKSKSPSPMRAILRLCWWRRQKHRVIFENSILMCRDAASVFSTQYNTFIVLWWSKLTIITEEKCPWDVGVSNPHTKPWHFNRNVTVQWRFNYDRWTEEDTLAGFFFAFNNA